MIFVCVGSREYPFDRLIRAVDALAGAGQLTEPVFMQIGSTAYEPVHCAYARWLDADAFDRKRKEASLVISHAGTGALIGALKCGKQVLSVPRLKAFGEHIDDHQLEVSHALAEAGYLREVLDMDDLARLIRLAYDRPIEKRYDRPQSIVPHIERFLKERLP